MGRPRTLNITADTNVLVRYIVKDDVEQWRLSSEVLEGAARVAVPLSVLCELGWVLRTVYSFTSYNIAAVMETLSRTSNLELNRSAVEAGLLVLNAGGDFADGVIAFEGAWLGGETFVSFDRKAVRLLKNQGYETQLLAGASEH